MVVRVHEAQLGRRCLNIVVTWLTSGITCIGEDDRCDHGLGDRDAVEQEPDNSDQGHRGSIPPPCGTGPPRILVQILLYRTKLDSKSSLEVNNHGPATYNLRDSV